MNDKPRLTAILLTVLIAAITVTLMLMTHISADPGDRTWPPKRQNDVALVEDENIFEVVEMPRAVSRRYDEAAPAKNDVNENNRSTPEPTTGPDLHDRGPAGEAPAPVTSTRPAPVKRQTRPQPATTGPSQQELEEQRRQEEARRRATSATEGAFDRSKGRNNTSNEGPADGNSGSVNGTNGSYHGTGTGSVNGGWIIPRYRRVPSTVTGTIVVRATINSRGEVTDVSLRGGKAPASTDKALRQAVVAEVKQRRFTRNDNNAPAQSVAVITYRFE